MLKYPLGRFRSDGRTRIERKQLCAASLLESNTGTAARAAEPFALSSLPTQEHPAVFCSRQLRNERQKFFVSPLAPPDVVFAKYCTGRIGGKRVGNRRSDALHPHRITFLFPLLISETRRSLNFYWQGCSAASKALGNRPNASKEHRKFCKLFA